MSYKNFRAIYISEAKEIFIANSIWPKKIKKKQMKKIIHFFEIAVFAIRLSVMNSDARRAFFSSIRPVL